MKLRGLVIAISVALACVVSSNASANPLTLSTPGIVGTLDGKVGDSNPTTELAIAQQILDLVGLGMVSPGACTQCYKTSEVFDYSGTLSNPIQSPDDAFVVPLGYEYVIAKYSGGQHGGYALFHLPTFGSNTLPQYPANLWTTNPTKYAISHFTTLSVPDGGSTVALLGSALFAVGFLRRRLGVGKLYDSDTTRFDESL